MGDMEGEGGGWEGKREVLVEGGRGREEMGGLEEGWWMGWLWNVRRGRGMEV